MTANDILKMHTIVDIDDYVHIIDGKCVCYKPDVIDFTDEVQVADLFAIVSQLWVAPDFPEIWGEGNTRAILTGYRTERKKCYSPSYIDGFPDELRKRVYHAIRDYKWLQEKVGRSGKSLQDMTVDDMMRAHSIVDIDEYIHVIDGKCVVYEPDTICLKDRNQVLDLFELVSLLWVDKAYLDAAGENNTYMFIVPDKDKGKWFLSRNAISDFPDDIRRSVLNAIDEFQREANMNFKEKQTVGFQARNLKREVWTY